MAGLAPGSVMIWLEQQLQTSFFPKPGELRFYTSPLISMRCSGSNKLGSQREKGGQNALCGIYVCTCLCMCIYMHTCIYAHIHTHMLTLTYIPLSIGGFTSAYLGHHSPPFLPGRAGQVCEVSLCCVLPPPSVLCLPPKSSEIAGSACRDAGSNLGLILGSTCDMASFTSCPVVVSMSCVCEIVHAHAHTLTHIHPPHPQAVY